MAKQSKPNTKSARSAREEAAAARAASVAAEKRRQRIINITIAIVIGVVVVGIIGGAVIVSNQTKQESGAVANPDAPVPTGAYASGEELAYGVPYGSNPDAVVVAVWEDFQCPACKAFETSAGANLKATADAGDILLVTRTTTFLDRSLGTDHSRRASAAYGCAVDAGKGIEFKETVYANQPATEGDGWTDDQLVSYAEEVGVTGEDLTTFQTCFTDRVYLPWATNSTEEFYNSGVGGTPSVSINGEEVATADVTDPVKFQALIDAAAAAPASPAPSDEPAAP